MKKIIVCLMLCLMFVGCGYRIKQKVTIKPRGTCMAWISTDIIYDGRIEYYTYVSASCNAEQIRKTIKEEYEKAEKVLKLYEEFN